MYRMIRSAELTDGEGNVLAFFIETNGPSFKFYAELRKVDESLQRVAPEWYPAHDPAVAEFQAKVNEATTMGWKVSATSTDNREPPAASARTGEQEEVEDA